MSEYPKVVSGFTVASHVEEELLEEALTSDPPKIVLQKTNSIVVEGMADRLDDQIAIANIKAQR